MMFWGQIQCFMIIAFCFLLTENSYLKNEFYYEVSFKFVIKGPND